MASALVVTALFHESKSVSIRCCMGRNGKIISPYPMHCIGIATEVVGKFCFAWKSRFLNWNLSELKPFISGQAVLSLIDLIEFHYQLTILL